VLVATETGMLHQLRRANPVVRWEPVNPAAVCRFMKMTTPATLLRCLRDGVAEVNVAPDVARRARRAVQAMIAAGASSGGASPGGASPAGASPAGASPAGAAAARAAK
jgi:quinolinate synthase